MNMKDNTLNPKPKKTRHAEPCGEGAKIPERGAKIR